MPFTVETATLASRNSHAEGKRVQRPHPLEQVCDMQAMLLKDVLNPELEPRQRAQCACAWEKLEDRKRILKGIGAPKPVDTSKGTKSKHHDTGPIESVETPVKPNTEST